MNKHQQQYNALMTWLDSQEISAADSCKIMGTAIVCTICCVAADTEDALKDLNTFYKRMVLNLHEAMRLKASL